MNPTGDFEPVSTDLLAFLLDGRVSILDIPCGSGGGLLGLLCAIAESRLNGALPRTPIEVVVHGADISRDAMAIHEAMLARVEPSLAEAGVRVAWGHSEWDVRDEFSTARLMDDWFGVAGQCEEFLVFVSAFSGFAHNHSDIVLKAVRDIAIRFHNKPVLVAWIEPDSHDSKRFLPKVADFFGRLFGLSASTVTEGAFAHFRYKHPFTFASLPGRTRVVHFNKIWERGGGA